MTTRDTREPATTPTTPATTPTTADAPARRPSEFSTLEAIRVTSVRDVTFTLRVLPQADPAAPVVLILPAMAMKAKFYLPLARALHRAGLSVVTCDLRAQGESTPELLAQPDFGYRDLIEVDLPAIVGAVARRFPDVRPHLFGHSLGGQLALLFAAAEPTRVAGVGVIGTGTVYWKAFGPRRWIEALYSIQTIGLVARVRGHWPGGMLIGGAMAGGVMTDWARHSRTSRYRPRGSSRNYDRLLRELTLPVLAISLDADRLGPRSNVDFLCTRLPAAELTRWHVEEDSGVTNRDHFAWIKDSAVIGASIAAWIQRDQPR